MIFLKRYKKYVIDRAEYGGFIFRCTTYYYKKKKSGETVLISPIKYKSGCTLHVRLPHDVSIEFLTGKKGLQSLKINECYDSFSGYKREIIKSVIVKGKCTNPITLIRTVECYIGMPLKMRETYYDALKEYFMCRILY